MTFFLGRLAVAADFRLENWLRSSFHRDRPFKGLSEKRIFRGVPRKLTCAPRHKKRCEEHSISPGCAQRHLEMSSVPPFFSLPISRSLVLRLFGLTSIDDCANTSGTKGVA